MTDGSEETARTVEEVRRRLLHARLHRFTVIAADSVDYDVRVLVTPPDAGVAAQVADLCGDLRVEVVQGSWRRN